jgi:MoaA/NifB/PqqE/SkfB family radical SAM enzyme
MHFKPIAFKSLQIHAAHSCNLSCESCSAFSHLIKKGILEPKQIQEWLALWQGRLLPEKVCVLGGEPLLNPKLAEIIQIVGSEFSDTSIKKILFTNGLLWKPNKALAASLKKFSFEIRVTIHSIELDYLKKLETVLDTIRKESGLNVLLFNGTGRNLPEFEFSDEKWTRRYYEREGKLYPINSGNQRKSWEICPGKYSTQLLDGRLWKCPPIAYFRLVPEERRDSPLWKRFNEYQGLSPGCTDHELKAFFETEDESICNLCPDNPQPFEKPNPVRGRIA